MLGTEHCTIFPGLQVVCLESVHIDVLWIELFHLSIRKLRPEHDGPRLPFFFLAMHSLCLPLSILNVAQARSAPAVLACCANQLSSHFSSSESLSDISEIP